MTVHRVYHQLMYFYVFIIPQATVRQWRIIRAWVNRAIAGIDDAPAAFGTDFAHGCTRMRHLLAGAERVRRAVKTICRGHGTDSDGLEENVVSRVSTHVKQALVQDPRSDRRPIRCQWIAESNLLVSGFAPPRSSSDARSGSQRRLKTLLA